MTLGTRSTTLVLLALLAISLPGCGPSFKSLHTFVGSTMGTRYEVRLLGHLPDPEALLNAIEQELATIDLEMSTWREDSDISRFNAGTGETAVPIPGRLLEVIEAAQRLSEKTDGALDITLMPLALAWGFQGSLPPQVPDPESLAQLGRLTGMHLLELSAEQSTLSKRHAGVMIDVSALAKGYAVDRLAGLLMARGFDHFMVEIGGEVRARGERSGGGPWRIAVELPGSKQADNDAAAVQYIQLQNQAVASSGDYRNHFVIEGRRYAHVLDPATHRPAAFGTEAVTVIAQDTMTADALATAFMAMPASRALEIADSLGVEVLITSRDADGSLRLQHSPGFRMMQLR